MEINNLKKENQELNEKIEKLYALINENKITQYFANYRYQILYNGSYQRSNASNKSHKCIRLACSLVYMVDLKFDHRR